MKILAATDGSRGGSAALRFARRLAGAKPGSRLVVLTVMRPEEPGENGSGRVGSRRWAEKTLQRAARQMKGRAAEFIARATRGGAAVPETIAREANRMSADLVVVGSEGRDTLQEWVIGGTALRLVYISRRPVTVVRPPRRRNTI